MLSPLHICWYCTDEYDPVEYAPGSVDPDEPGFCSDDCQDRWTAAEDAADAYAEAGYPASVFGP